jgi:hypothetical protein
MRVRLEDALPFAADRLSAFIQDRMKALEVETFP